jgi:VCBS repeat protein/FG-GAP repeat protein/Big-like domain-containing protein
MTVRTARMAMAVAAIAGVTRVAGAQQLTFARDTYASFTGARAMATGDFDRNGWPDVAQANAGRNTVTILLNQQGTLKNAFDIPVGAGPFDIVTGDFTGDGILDLAVACADANAVAILIGRGDGTFVHTGDLALPQLLGPRGITTADVNGDGFADVVATGYNSSAIVIGFGNGSGGITRTSAFRAFAAQPQGVAVADFNRDGRPDVLVAYDSSGGLAVMYGTATSPFMTGQKGIAGAQYLNVVATGDFNRDGWIDVAAASTRDSRVAVYLGSATGLTFSRAYATGASPRGITVADLNDDGLPDIVTANYAAGTVSVLLGSKSTPGTFAAAMDVAANQGSRAVVSADFDRDGRLDLATANQSVAAATVLVNQTIFKTAAFSFTKRSLGTPSNSSGSSDAARTADFNRDGKLDVATLSSSSFNAVDVILNGGSTQTLKGVTFMDAWTVADFDNDGNPDILVEQGSDTLAIAVFLGDGHGGFSAPHQTTGSLRVADRIAVGLMNGDAFPDVVVNGYDATLGTYVLLVLTGAGDGTFRQASKAPIGEFAAAMTTADINRDGKQDVVALTYQGLQVWTGDGPGALARTATQTVGLKNIISSVTTGDLNGDGYPDVVASSDGSLAILLGGSAGLGAPAYIDLIGEGAGNGSTAIGDVNVDGHADIVTDQGLIFIGHGDGTFTPTHFDYFGYGVAVADFNGDGLPDILCGASEGEVGLLLNQRNDVNHAPVITFVGGKAYTFSYQSQFEDWYPTVYASASDPDAHALTYRWTDESGAVVSNDSGLELAPPRRPGTYKFFVTVEDGRGGSASDALTVTIAPTKEVVLWAGDWVYTTSGPWTIVADATAAGGTRVYNVNANQPKVAAPLANPATYADIPFVADPTQTYKLWIRLKADGDSFANDSVWVQFSGATDAAGNPVYRQGTTSGLAVNLEECSGCGIAGWGWEDDGWGAVNKNGVTLRFPEGGLQHIRIQTREDGVSIDQIVLSSEKYLTARPGTAKNDKAILARTFFPSED